MMPNLFPSTKKLNSFSSRVLAEIRKLIRKLGYKVDINDFSDFIRFFVLNVDVICKKVERPADTLFSAFNSRKFYNSQLGKLALSAGEEFVIIFAGIHNELFVLVPYNSQFLDYIEGTKLVINKRYIVLRLQDYITGLFPIADLE